MAVDTPARIAILGAGPIGLEAALYARFLGYEVEVFEHMNWVAHKTRNKECRLLTPFRNNCSSLGLAAIAAQDSGYVAPPAGDYLTVHEWHDRYLGPLSQVDLISESLRLPISVDAIGKVELRKFDCPTGEFDRGAWDFRLLIARDLNKEWEIGTADVILDCSGTKPCFVGHGGLAEAGEVFRSRDYSECLPAAYLNKTVVVVGDDVAAASSILMLVELMGEYPDTCVTWITPRERTTDQDAPLYVWEEDSLPERSKLLARANELARNGTVRWLPGTWIEAIRSHPGGQLSIETSGEHPGVEIHDRVISQCGWQPDWFPQSELQLDICPITDAPRPFSNYLLKRHSPYSVEYPAPDPTALITSEPNYYVLGSKSFGRMPGFLFQHGLRQIRDVFTIIGDRADLDLYAQIK